MTARISNGRNVVFLLYPTYILVFLVQLSNNSSRHCRYRLVQNFQSWTSF